MLTQDEGMLDENQQQLSFNLGLLTITLNKTIDMLTGQRRLIASDWLGEVWLN